MSIQATTSPDERTADATIRFRRDQLSSGVSRTGQLHPGGELRVEYDPTRLIPSPLGASDTTEILCHARFEPAGEEHSGALQFFSNVASQAQSIARRGLFQTRIPSDSKLVELWFERRGPGGTEAWDSRYGQNYRFPVADDGLPVPEQSVAIRADAIIDPSRIEVVHDAAEKEQTSTSTGSTLRTDLRVSAQIARPNELTTAWADIHVFDATCELIHRDTIALHRPEPLSDEKITHTWSASVYQGSGGASGAGVWSRPDAHSVQYRLYCQVGDQVFTDGVLHQFDVRPDAEVRPIPGSW
jgi:hypothetical protein